MHTKDKGKIAELMISARLIELGWTILSPLCDHARYDIAAEKGGKFIRVSVSRKIYFIPASKLNTSSLKLRIESTKNKQQKKINSAKEFEALTI